MGALDAVLQDDDERGKMLRTILVGRRNFFRDELWRGWTGQEQDEYFSRWLSPISVGGPVLQWLKSCCILRAFTAAATTTTMAVLYGHAVVFPSVFLYVPFTIFMSFLPFFFSFLPAISPSVSVLSVARTTRIQPGKFYPGNGTSSYRRADCGCIGAS